MELPYEPPSDFLRAVISDEIPLSGTEFAEANFQMLVALMKAEDRANRDWATMLVAQSEVDTGQVRGALLDAAKDQDQAVRAEAILGLAQRDPGLALPLLRSALADDSALPPLFEAAALVADRSLIADLRHFSHPSDNAYIDQLVTDALSACEGGRASS